MPVIESIPSSKHTAYMKGPTIKGACILDIVQYIKINSITINPNTPHTLLLLTPE